MKQIFVNLGVERWPFGFVKSFDKQNFQARLRQFMPDKSEYGENGEIVMEAFDAVNNDLFRIWNDKTRRSLVQRTIGVLISFNDDYSVWKVDMDAYECGMPVPTAHPDFNSFAENEQNKIFEKYGFKEEKKPPKKFEVFYMGRKTIMSDEQFNDFHKDMVEMYPCSWHMMTRVKEVE